MTIFADNKTTTKITFDARKQYKTDTSLIQNPAPIDFLYEKGLYGRVDKDYNPICLKAGKGTKLVGTGDKIFPVMDFVADAYQALSNYINTCINIKRTINPPEDHYLREFKVLRGLADPSQAYHRHMMKAYSVFANKYLMVHRRREMVRGFDSFVKLFLEFVLEYSYHFPITKSSYMLSNHTDPMMTGLCVEFLKGDKAVDYDKYYFRSDAHNAFFKHATRLFGFKIDKNIPWRLVANLASPRMHQYIQRYSPHYLERKKRSAEWGRVAKTATPDPGKLPLPPVNLDNFFTKYYNKTHTTDIKNLQVYLVMFYNAYVRSFPSITVPAHCSDKPFVSIKRKLFVPAATKRADSDEARTQLYIQSLNQHYGKIWWLIKYYQIRKAELGEKIDETKLRNEAKKIAQLNKHFGYNKALDYVHGQTKIPFSIAFIEKTTYEAKVVPPDTPPPGVEGTTLAERMAGYVERSRTFRGGGGAGATGYTSAGVAIPSTGGGMGGGSGGY